MRSFILSLSSLFLFFSCTKAPSPTEKTATAPQDTLYVTQEPLWKIDEVWGAGSFINTDAHKLSGKFFLYHDVNDHVVLSVEELSVLGGPDVDLFLSDTNTYSPDAIRLGHLEGNDGQPIKGSLTYILDRDIDFQKYNHVIVWCKRYAVLFGYAPLVIGPGSPHK